MRKKSQKHGKEISNFKSWKRWFASYKLHFKMQNALNRQAQRAKKTLRQLGYLARWRTIDKRIKNAKTALKLRPSAVFIFTVTRM